MVVLALGLAAVFGVGALSAGARSAHESEVSPDAYLSTGALGAAAGNSALGFRTPYFDPPALANPDTPGFTINSGADQPDPFMTEAGGRYYLFTSQDKVPQNVPVRSGSTVGQWGGPSDALPDPPAWAAPGVMWAPDVAQFGDHYMLYFTSQLAGVSPATMCIGDAISTEIAGPYLAAPAPFICQQSLGGSIDPRVFVDGDGQPYMVWKSDQNARSNDADTQIYSQALSADGMHLVGQPAVIFGPDEAWQGHIVEAPQLVLVRGTYYLFYSGGWFNQPGYSIGAARCSGPVGPCADTSTQADPGVELAGRRTRGGVGLLQRRRGVAALHPLQFDAPPTGTAPSGLDGPPRLRCDGPYLAAPLDVSSSGTHGNG